MGYKAICQIGILVILLTLGFQAPLASAQADTQHKQVNDAPPGLQALALSEISPAAAENLEAGRVDHGGQNTGLRPPISKRSASRSASATIAPSAPIPSSVSELARALKYDPALIFEFVHNSIEYSPIWSVMKGSTGTLIDGAGTGLDIAQLTADLINADPSHAATATLVRGRIQVVDTDAASWLGLNGMNVCPVAYSFGGGGIPYQVGLNSYPSCAGGGVVQISHVWVKFVTGGTTYEIDPSFKAHSVVNSSVNLASVTGYDRSSYLSAVCSGCNADPKVLTTLNRASILDPANAQSLPTYSRKVLAYLQANNIHDLSQVIGGHAIVKTYGAALPTTLPYTVVSRDADPFVIDGTWRASVLVNTNGISQLFSSDAVYGKRLTITFNSGNYPQLNLDGAVVQTGTTAATPGSKINVALSVCVPVSGVNCSSSSVDGAGKATWCNAAPIIRCTIATITSGGTYALSNSWGTIGHNMVQRHQQALLQAQAAGVAPTAEANLGEVATLFGYSWTEQAHLYQSLSEDGRRNGGFPIYYVGFAGHSGTSGGPYVDLPLVVSFPGAVEALNGDGTYTPSIRGDNFYDLSTQLSILESTTITQSAVTPSVSTAKLIDIGAALTSSNNIYSLASCADYSTYSGQLIGYASSDLATVQSLVCSQGFRVVLPQRGNLSDPAATTATKWVGAGYYATKSGAGQYQLAALISGGYAGGFSADQQTPTVTQGNVVTTSTPSVLEELLGPGALTTLQQSIRSPSSSPCDFSCSVTSGVSKILSIVSDPVDSLSGSFLSVSNDITTGESDSSSLSFDRSYFSANVQPSTPFGQGWRGSMDNSSQVTSDGVRPTGMYDAWDAAELLAVKLVNHDLLSDPNLPVLNIAVASIGNRWIGDRLINNSVAMSTGAGSFSFLRLADDSYNPAQGITGRLNGSPSNWILTSSNGARMQFGAPTAGVARATSVLEPDGRTTNFTYTAGQLTQVSNNLGRTINLGWTGSHVTSVSDAPLSGSPARTVSYTYVGNLLQQVTDVRGGRTLYCYDSAGRIISYYLPTQGSGTDCGAAGANITNTYDSLGRVQKQIDAAGHVTDLYLAGTRAETVTHPLSGVADIRAIRYFDDFGNVVRDVSPRTGLPTVYSYDALSRLVRTDYPEGGAVELSYDIRSNPVHTCAIPKTAVAYPACDMTASSPHIWTTTTYNELPAVWDCANKNSCNKPSSTTDALGNTINYGYNADGTLASVILPTPGGYAGAPKTVYSYTPTASIAGNVNLLTSVQVTSTASTTPSVTTSYGYDTAANGLTLRTATLDPSGLGYTTTYAYDGYGNRTSVKGSRTDVDDTVTFAFDAGRNPTTITGPNPGSGPPITQTTYDGNSRVTSIARKFGANWMVTCTTYTASGQVQARFGSWKTSSPTDCSFSGNTAVPYVSYGYDGADRLTTTTQSLPEGNRVTQIALLPDNRVGSVTRAYGTPDATTESTSYSNDGLPTSVTDARGNVTGMAYDGFDRLTSMGYPLAGGGGPSTTDIVAFAYDKRGAITGRSIRGTGDASATCVQCIRFTYDTLGRVVQKTVPTMAANTGVQPNVAAVPGYAVSTHYDLLGRLDSRGYSASSPELSFAYDNASRLTAATQYGRTVGYSYGPPSQGMARTMTWPGGAGIELTCTDALGRVTQIKEAADCTTATGQLVLYGYDDLSRRTSTTRANGASSSYTYTDTGALWTLSHAIGGGGSVTSTFGYNRALQVTGRTTDNDLYAWTNHYNVTRDYAPNGLDQYGRIRGDAMAWDARGNLAAYRGVSYGYDGENRLAASAMAAGTATLGYDPAGRLRRIGAAAPSELVYDGPSPIAEYDAASGAVITRFVPGAGGDETVAAYDAAGAKSWYHADATGSVIATSDASGNVAVVDQYGPFGEPGLVYQGRNQGRLRYAGQIALPELAPYGGPSQPLYSMRARVYAPKLGRFLQTDPIGAADDRNLYAYAGNDPVNRVDPSGLAAEAVVNAVTNHPVATAIGTVAAVGTAACIVFEPCGIGEGAALGIGGSAAAGGAELGVGALAANEASLVSGAAGATLAEGGEALSIGYHATSSEAAESILQGGFRLGTQPGRLGSGGVYVNDTVEGAIGEFGFRNPGVNPTVLKVEYNAGVNAAARVPPANYVNELPLNVDSVSAPSVRIPNSTNTNILNGSARAVGRVP